MLLEFSLFVILCFYISYLFYWLISRQFIRKVHHIYEGSQAFFWRISFMPNKLKKAFRPTLFIDDKCKTCRLVFAKWIKNLDLSKNIIIKSLDEISQEGHKHLDALAKSKTTMIFVEPKIDRKAEDNLTDQFYYSTKGRAFLRLFKYIPAPFCLIAAHENILGIPFILDLFYNQFVKLVRAANCSIK